MKLLRLLLFPISALYGCITYVRNLLFDLGILKSYQFNLPIIAVGNLNMGGTGKTPQIEYLIRLLSTHYKVATLSRGYKRKSSGFIVANNSSTAATLGDEPYQFYKKFSKIQVAVDANRKNGIENLLKSGNKPQIILLDDAFQHRKVRAGFYILLTTFNDLYSTDFVLPTGNLRENKSGAKRANIIIVTKCPANLSQIEQKKIIALLNIKNAQKVFFSYISYDDKIYSETETIELTSILNQPKLLLTGIAKPEPFYKYLNQKLGETLTYPDHHYFSEKDIKNIKQKAQNRPIITTEKDYVRLANQLSYQKLYYLPIKSSFITNGATFDKIILNYVESSSRNS